MYVIEFGRGPDKKKRKKKRTQIGESVRKEAKKGAISATLMGSGLLAGGLYAKSRSPLKNVKIKRLLPKAALALGGITAINTGIGAAQGATKPLIIRAFKGKEYRKEQDKAADKKYRERKKK